VGNTILIHPRAGMGFPNLKLKE
jgi:hypothetical protein